MALTTSSLASVLPCAEKFLPVACPAKPRRLYGIVLVEIAIDDALSGVDRGAALRIDDGDLPCVATRVLIGDALDDVCWCEPLLEQRDRLWPVLTVRRRLGRNRADTGLDIGTAAPAPNARDCTPTPNSLVAGSTAMMENVENHEIRYRRFL